MDQAEQESERLTRFTERYTSGEVPWDDVLPPPEVQELVSTLPPGRALDLGCGYGRTAIYLAQHGWQVEGIDFVPQAIEEANRRAAAQGVAGQIQFHVASVADLGFLNGRYDLAIDIGCMHSLSLELQTAYRDELLRLLQPAAAYLLFARLQHPDEEPSDGHRGIDESELKRLFTPFKLQKSEIGVTEGADYKWQSGWFWYVR
ncbi:class I SAM-dependent methyltransferase [Candidatus Leptofilum sp.]|uniref:class I SAM-dependent methyltransferase n=1 Tax=Candidatus Leptofilum sp. TaxID=3241576 RepID=UPI003B5B8CA5